MDWKWPDNLGQSVTPASAAVFRGVPLAQVIYCGDDPTGGSWDHRS